MWTVAKVQGTEVLHGSGCLGPGHPSITYMRTNPAREGDEMETTGAAARHANPELAQRFLRDVMPLHDQLHRAARRMTRNSSDAEDLVQDTLIRAFTGFSGYQHGNPRALRPHPDRAMPTSQCRPGGAVLRRHGRPALQRDRRHPRCTGRYGHVTHPSRTPAPSPPTHRRRTAHIRRRVTRRSARGLTQLPPVRFASAICDAHMS
jgi:hypothetical protein